MVGLDHAAYDVHKVRAERVDEVRGHLVVAQAVPRVAAARQVQVGRQLEYGHAQAEYVRRQADVVVVGELMLALTQ